MKKATETLFGYKMKYPRMSIANKKGHKGAMSCSRCIYYNSLPDTEGKFCKNDKPQIKLDKPQYSIVNTSSKERDYEEIWHKPVNRCKKTKRDKK
jgi:hypothetical protein